MDGGEYRYSASRFADNRLGCQTKGEVGRVVLPETLLVGQLGPRYLINRIVFLLLLLPPLQLHLIPVVVDRVALETVVCVHTRLGRNRIRVIIAHRLELPWVHIVVTAVLLMGVLGRVRRLVVVMVFLQGRLVRLPRRRRLEVLLLLLNRHLRWHMLMLVARYVALIDILQLLYLPVLNGRRGVGIVRLILVLLRVVRLHNPRV